MKQEIKALKYEKFKVIIHPLLIGMMTQKTTGRLVVEGEIPSDNNYLIVIFFNKRPHFIILY